MAFEMFVALAILVWLKAPALVLSTVADKPTASCFAIITPWQPAAFALRIIAPRLCGSVILSHITTKGGSPFSFA